MAAAILMNVYVVIKPAASNEGDGDEIIGIYSDRDRAGELLVASRRYTDCTIEEWEVDSDPPGVTRRGV